MMTIDPEVAALGILGRADDDPIAPRSVRDDEFGGSYVPDALDKFLADAELGAKLGRGGHQRVENLKAELAPLDAAVATHYKSLAARALQKVSPEVYYVGGEPLAKGEIESRMLGVLAKIRPFCVGEEATLIEGAVRCLDFSLFGELTEPVLSRMKDALQAI